MNVVNARHGGVSGLKEIVTRYVKISKGTGRNGKAWLISDRVQTREKTIVHVYNS